MPVFIETVRVSQPPVHVNSNCGPFHCNNEVAGCPREAQWPPYGLDGWSRCTLTAT
eukprot:m.58117 g.58117  ORF g.58117 m.58117 type:complete len:56 (+) comp7806_c1_seq1:60-227(+)